MKLLLDTHVLLWALEDSPRLTRKIRNLIIDESNQIYVSVISLWEIAIKHQKNPEIMKYSATQIRDYSMRAGYIFLSLGLDAIADYDANDLSVHKDPFDQMLVCQSHANNMRLITHDAKLKSFPIGFVEYF